MLIRFVAIALTTVTGMSGLVYEVSWQKYLAILVGSHSEATAAVLAIFLGGLSLGYALFGVVTRRLVDRSRARGTPARLLRVYGLVEIGIGLYALLFPGLFGAAQRASLLAPDGGAGLAFAFDVGLSALLIGPPTVLMGSTIPMLTLALAGDLRHATRIHAWVYGFNTAGAFVGALAAAFFLIPSFGLDGTLISIAWLNLLAGGCFVVLDPWAAYVTPDFDEAPGAPVRGLRSYAAVALLAGFAMMTLQTALNRIGALALGSSPFTFAMIVAVFVLCIALGSLLVSAMPRIPAWLLPGSQWLLVLLLGALYFQVDSAPYWAYRLRAVFKDHDTAFYPFQLLLLQSLLVVLALPIGISGALLPLVFDRLRRGASGLGSVAGRLYAWNTVGSLLGALVGGYVLFFWLDLHEVYRVALGAVVLAALLLSALVWRRIPAPAFYVAAPVAWLLLLALPPWSAGRITAGTFRERDPGKLARGGLSGFRERAAERNVVFYDDDPTSTVSVVREEDGGEHSQAIVVNGKSDGDIRADFVTMALTGLLPALMAESHERAFVVGFGTGVTAGELAALERTRRVDVAEISDGVIEAAPLFDYGNQAASRSPKVRVQRNDAYRALLKSRETYDLIVSEPSNPWVAGVEMLYTTEFLEAARDRLAPGGVYAQWFHLYEVDDDTVQLVLRTYASVFRHVSVWFTLRTDLLLLGFDDAGRALDVRALQARFERADFRAGFARAKIDSFPALLAHELLPLGVIHARPSQGPIHTLRHPILSDMAARAFFRGDLAQLPIYADRTSAEVGTRNSLLRRLASVGPGEALPEPILRAAVDQVCGHQRVRECTTLLASWLYAYPRSEQRKEVAASVERTPNLPVSPAVVRELARLFGRRPPVQPGAVPARRLLAITARYMEYFHHATPFALGGIEARWRRCLGAACGELAKRAGGWLGVDLAPGRALGDVPAISRPAELTAFSRPRRGLRPR